MSDTDTTQAVWYLARDGQQYGPITDDELRKLVELSHLQDGDLVWSPAYSEWQPASVAVELFKPAAPTAQPVPPPSAPTPPQAPDAATMQPEPRPAAPEPAATEPVVTGAPSQPNRDDIERARQGQFEDPATGSRTAAEVDARQSAYGGSRPAEQSRAQAEEAQRSFEVTAPVGYQAGTGRAPDPLTDRPTQTGMRTDPMRPSRSAEPHPAAHVHERTVGTTRAPAPEMHGRHVSVDDDHYDDEDSGGGWIKAVAAVVVLGLVGVGGWFAYESREQILAMVEGSSSGGAAPVVRAGTDRETTTSGSEQRTAVATPAASAPQSNVALFSTNLWKTLNTAFPDWSTARRAEVQQFQAAGREPAFIERHLVNQMAQLRRQHADAALSSSPTALKSVASAFLTNLRALSSRSVDTCYAFISSGETSPKILPLMSDTQAAEPLRRQMRVVVDAIVDGRTNPKTYLPPRQSDFSVISGELSKMGWSSDDMRLFGDPQALAKAPPAKVCQLVTDWFTAQLMVSDPQIQSRLLVQSLRPVVAG